MCDLSQLRSHLSKMEKTYFPAERLGDGMMSDLVREGSYKIYSEDYQLRLIFLRE